MHISAKRMLLLDGLGAIVTATMLGQVLARFEHIFGMPKDILYLLSGVALCFAAFSILSHLFVKKAFSINLRIILVANFSYCIATASLVVLLYEELTWLGVSYFIGEIIVVLGIVYAEYKTVKYEANKGMT